MLFKLKGLALKTLFKSVLFTVLKAAFKVSLIAMVAFSMAHIGLLPPSPFRLVNNMIMTAQAQTNIMRYLPVFVPIFEMVAVLSAWVGCIILWYGVKHVLRIGKVIQ